MTHISVLGIDLAKNVFQLHGVDQEGNILVKKKLTRQKLNQYIMQLPPCLIGIEACSASHYWARQFESYGHEVKIMSPQYVKPYVKSNKNDQNDAAAIAEAVTRPSMRFVPKKSLEQQDLQLLHRMRSQLIKQRTATSNQIRGFLAEYGMTIPMGLRYVRNQLPGILEDAENGLTVISRAAFNELYQALQHLDGRIQKLESQIEAYAEQEPRCQRLVTLRGIGPLTATAIFSTVGDGSAFSCGRHLAAYLGLVPKQRGSGGKSVMLGLSKRGDKYLRYLLIHGARSVIFNLRGKTDDLSLWITEKLGRSNVNVTSAALASKTVRMAWALLSKEENYREPKGSKNTCEQALSTASVGAA